VVSIVRIGVIGAGQAGARHAAAYLQVPETRVTVVVDPDIQRGQALAAQAGAAHLPIVDSSFWNTVDAVSICVPHSMLAAHALEAIAHGKHLLLEKPMALTLLDADTIIEAADRAGVTLMVGFVHRFRAEVAEARHLITAGHIGRPTLAVEHMVQGVGPRPGWIWQQTLAGGGVLLYSGIHGLDRLRWLIGSEATEVYARSATVVHEADVEDVLISTITFANGAFASCMQHTATYPLPSGWRSEIYGTTGAITIAPNQTMTIHEPHRTVQVHAQRDDRFLGEIREFVSAIRGGRPPAVTGADGRAALAIALALYESARTGEPVSLATPSMI